jgi:hypothetical protein
MIHGFLASSCESWVHSLIKLINDMELEASYQIEQFQLINHLIDDLFLFRGDQTPLTRTHTGKDWRRDDSRSTLKSLIPEANINNSHFYCACPFHIHRQDFLEPA